MTNYKISKNLLVSLEDKFLRHGYCYTGSNEAKEVQKWLDNHKRFRNFKAVIEDDDGFLAKVTLIGWIPYSANF